MTLSTTTAVIQYTGTGADTALPTGFPFFVATDIRVTQRIAVTGVDTVLTNGTHYTVTGGSSVGATGTVTPVNGAVNFTTAMVWTIQRVVPLTQSLDYVENDNFPAASHEAGLDRLTMQSQDRQSVLTRSLRFPVGDALGLTSQLPDAVDRASKALQFDSSGNVVVVSPTSASGTTVLAADSSVTSTTSRTLATRFAEVIHVKDYGCKVDGTTDDSANFQIALNAANALGGAIVQLPSGRMKLAATVVVFPFTTIQGVGQAGIAVKGSELFADTDIVMLSGSKSNPSVTSEITNNITLRDLQIQNNFSGTKTKYEVEFKNPIDCKLDNVHLMMRTLTVTDVGGVNFFKDGSPASGPFICTVENSRIQQASVRFVDVSDSHVVNSFVWGHTRPHCVLFENVGGGVHGCELIGSPTNGAIRATNTSGGIIVEGNFFDGSSSGVDSGRGINFLNVDNSTVVGNRISNQSSDSFYFEDCTHTSVLGNVFRNNNKDDDGSDDVQFNSVTVACVGNVIVGNTFQQSNAKTSPGKCILIADNGAASTNNVVALNTATSTNYTASTITGGSASTVFENRGTGLVNLVTFADTSFNADVAMGTAAAPNGSAVLDLVSTTKAFMPPRMTTAQRDAIVSPVAGMVVYNTTTNVLNFHNGTAWGAV